MCRNKQVLYHDVHENDKINVHERKQKIYMSEKRL